MSFAKLKCEIYKFSGYIVLAAVIILGTFAKDYTVSYLAKQEWSAAELSKDIERYKLVQSYLVELRIKTNAQRVVVYYFHNGGFFSNGMPYKKMSMAYEAVQAGISPELNKSQNLPLSQFSDALFDLINNSDPTFSTVNDMKDSSWKFLMENNGVDSIYKQKIESNGKIIGFIEIEFDHNEKASSEYLSLLNNYKNRIQTILSL